MIKPLPFVLDPKSIETFTNQLVNGVKAAIIDGYYRDGEVLPTWAEAARSLGVSTRIPRDAYHRLANEGYLIARPRLGSCVSSSHGFRSWKGTVLLVCMDKAEATYNIRRASDELRRRFAKSGYSLLSAAVREPKCGVYDFSEVESLIRFKTDFAILFCNKAKIRHRFSKYGIPFFMVGFGCQVPDGIGAEADAAIAEFVHRCKGRKVHRVVEVGFCTPAAIDLSTPLKAVGIGVERWRIAPDDSLPRTEGVRLAAFEAFVSRYGKGDVALPDLFAFNDDYVAEGAFFALSSIGLSMPDDVRAVTLANEGNLPLATKRPAAILCRPAAIARNVANLVLARLNAKPVSAAEPVWVYSPGDTFP